MCVSGVRVACNVEDLAPAWPLHLPGSMRIAPILVTLMVAGTAHADVKQPVVQKAITASAAGKPDDAHTLSRTEIDARMKPLSAQLQRCYLEVASDVRGAGKLDVTLTVHRNGQLWSVETSLPGLSASTAKKVDACVKTVVAGTTFPTKKSFTTVVVPFLFQHTAAPNSGPQMSCWDPNGCR